MRAMNIRNARGAGNLHSSGTDNFLACLHTRFSEHTSVDVLRTERPTSDMLQFHCTHSSTQGGIASSSHFNTADIFRKMMKGRFPTPSSVHIVILDLLEMHQLDLQVTSLPDDCPGASSERAVTRYDLMQSFATANPVGPKR